MLMRTLPSSTLVLIAALALTAGWAWGMGSMLGETKEQLKLRYDVAVQDHGTGRVTVVLTIADQGRLGPLDAVELVVPKAEGSGFVDLAVSLATSEANGKRVARAHLKKEWAERAEIWLTTSTLDGKQAARTRYHHVIPIAKHLKSDPAATAAPTAAPTTAPKS